MLLFLLCYQIFLTRVDTEDVNGYFIELNKYIWKKKSSFITYIE